MNHDINNRVKEAFGNKVVKKDLVQEAELEFLPRYVAEQILANFHNENIEKSEIIKKTKNFVNKHLPERNSTEILKHQLLEEGQIRILNEFHVKVHLKSMKYTASSQVFREPMKIDPDWVSSYPQLSGKGMWGLSTIRHSPNDSNYAAELIEFQPFQLGSFDFEAFAEARTKFTTEEWIDLLIKSSGLNPDNLKNTQVKIDILSRLLPLCVRNLNLVELGPKGTGKTYTFRHLTSYAHIASGSSISAPKLIYDLAKNSPGVLTKSDTVVFDEIAASEFGNKKDKELIGMLKDFMEGGSVNRGNVKVQEDTSIIYLGNVEVRGNKPKFEDFLKDMPQAFKDTAFIDRINGIIPGWSIPKISETSKHFSTDIGLTGNYLSEALHKIRSYSHPDLNWEKLDKKIYLARNEKSVKKIANGFLGLLFPGVSPTKEELQYVLDISCNLRQIVCDQLYLLEPDEYDKVELKVIVP